jgi:hypothetical protein
MPKQIWSRCDLCETEGDVEQKIYPNFWDSEVQDLGVLGIHAISRCIILSSNQIFASLNAKRWTDNYTDIRTAWENFIKQTPTLSSCYNLSPPSPDFDMLYIHADLLRRTMPDFDPSSSKHRPILQHNI